MYSFFQGSFKNDYAGFQQYVRAPAELVAKASTSDLNKVGLGHYSLTKICYRSQKTSLIPKQHPFLSVWPLPLSVYTPSNHLVSA